MGQITEIGHTLAVLYNNDLLFIHNTAQMCPIPVGQMVHIYYERVMKVLLYMTIKWLGLWVSVRH